MEKLHSKGCNDCEKEKRTLEELKKTALIRLCLGNKCGKCSGENPSILKIGYKTIPFADEIDKNYALYHELVILSLQNWRPKKNTEVFCYDCHLKHNEKVKISQNTGDYFSFISSN